MVAPSTPASKSKLSGSAQKEVVKQKQKQQQQSKKNRVIESSSQVDETKRRQSQPKRTKCPGVRVVGGRIYDSDLGKTCHQCRQKTLDFAASCKNQKKNKPCPIKFCHKCLLNRYGETAEEMEVLGTWKCPKCRGICNCSVCMKKRGQQPTGMLVLRAKASGFSSVSEMLHVNGPENFDHDKAVKDKGVSPRKMAASNKEAVVSSPRKRGKENSFAGNSDSNADARNLTPNPLEKVRKRKKQEVSREMQNGFRDDGPLLKKNSPTKPRLSNETSKTEERADGNDDANLPEQNISKMRASSEVFSDPIKKEENQEEKNSTIGKDVKVLDSLIIDNAGAKPETVVNYSNLKNDTMKTKKRDFDFDILLPQGADLTVVAGIELPPENVGDALQFIEFCAAFGKILNVKKGQPESILRELMHWRGGRRSQYSSVVQFHIQLLSLIQKDLGEESLSFSSENGKNSWLQALGKCISESQCSLKELPLDCFDQAGDAYDKLDFSKKLKLLNFLCDEALDTAGMRTWIEDQSKAFLAKKKEAQRRVLVARDKKKGTKQKLQDEVAKALIANNGAPLSISEHEAIVSQIKTEADQAHAEFLEAMEGEPMKKQSAEAVRTNPILLIDSGRVYWRLKGYSHEPDILLQEVGGWDAVVPSEKWFVHTVEQKKVIDKYISFLRVKGRRLKKVTDTFFWKK